MKQPRILVTGATGKTGRAVVDELLPKKVPVLAFVHSKDASSAALELPTTRKEEMYFHAK